jgi:hypothetical protein
LIHFSAVSTIIWLLIPDRHAQFWRSMAASSFVTCGQHSLAVYAFGTFLMFLTSFVFHMTGQSPISVIFTMADCWLLCFMTARLLGFRISQQRNALEGTMTEIR